MFLHNNTSRLNDFFFLLRGGRGRKCSVTFHELHFPVANFTVENADCYVLFSAHGLSWFARKIRVYFNCAHQSNCWDPGTWGPKGHGTVWPSGSQRLRKINSIFGGKMKGVLLERMSAGCGRVPFQLHRGSIMSRSQFKRPLEAVQKWNIFKESVFRQFSHPDEGKMAKNGV